MRKIYFLLIAFICFVKVTVAQTYTWIGSVSTDYQVAANWNPVRTAPLVTDNLSFNASSALDITNVANETIGRITIVSGTSNVSFSTNNPLNVLTISGATPLMYTTAGSILAADFLTIRLSSPLTIVQGTFGIAPSSGGKIIIATALTLNGTGILDFDVPGTGGTTITGSITYLAGTFNSVNTGAINWASTANYFHASGGLGASAIPVSIWSTGSTCSVTGMTSGTTAPTISSNITFANFTWNCPLQFGDVDFNLPVTTLFINGALTIVSTGTGTKYLRLSGAAGGAVMTGSYNQTGGNLMLQSSSGSTTLTVNGAFTHSAGILDGVGNGPTIGTANLNLKGNVNKSGGTWNSSSTSNAAQMNIEFSGTTGQNVIIAGAWTTTAAGRSNIIISNQVGVSLQTGSTLRVYNGTGSTATPAICTMTGILTAIGTAVVSYTGTGGCTLIYSGASLQTATAAEFPTLTNIPTNLTINNGLGVSFPLLFNRTISGTLTLLSGNLAIGINSTGPVVDNILTLNNPILAGQLSYTGGFITTGTLTRLFPQNGLPSTPSQSSLFPFGIGANDRSLNIFFPTGSVNMGGTIAVSHTPLVNTTPISLPDNTVNLDKRTNSYWTISTSTIVPTGSNVSITAVGGNIGAIDDIIPLRLTDGSTTNLGTLIASTGTTSIPIIGKSGLDVTTLNRLYYGSNGNLVPNNPLLIITFTWTGLGGNSNWTNSANWTSPNTVGYPSASTEEAIITNTAAPFQPTINSIDNISVYRLTVGAGMTLTMLPSAVINVFDVVSFTGTATFARLSTFTYASSSNPQTALNLPYGSLAFSGTASKILPAIITITGSYAISGASPNITSNFNTFIYAAVIPAVDQNIAPGSYYNLTITGDRGNKVVTLGPSSSASVTINIANNFDVTNLTNYKDAPQIPLSYTTVNYSSTSSQTITGFRYPFSITNSGNGIRILDNRGGGPLGNPKYIIYCRTMTRGTGAYTILNSKVNIYAVGVQNPLRHYFIFNQPFYDLEFSGDQLGRGLEFMEGEIYIAGKFNFSMKNFKQVLNKDAYFVFNGSEDQTIPAFSTVGTTPAFKFPNIAVTGGNRDIYLAGTDTIGVTGGFQVPRLSVDYIASLYFGGSNLTITQFNPNKGFIVGNSTINFSIGSGFIPQLIPSAIGTFNYNNLAVTSGIRLVQTNNMTIGGDLSVGVDSATTTTGVLSPATIKIGDGTNSRTFNVLGNVTASAATGTPLNTAQIDLNPGTTGSTTMNVSKSLFITTQGQITGTGESNGTIVFKGVLPHTYTSSSTLKNGFVNFQVGDGIINNYSKLTLLSNMDLVRSGFGGVDIPKIGTLTVLPNDSLDCGIYNVVSNLSNGTNGNAKFDLQTNATLITANTGGIEGTASGSSTGSVINDATLVKTYSPTASYLFNAASATNMSFPTTPATFPMANLTLGNNTNAATFTLNKPIAISDSFKLRNSATIDLSGSDVTLISTATKTARVSQLGTSAALTYGTGRFNIERYYPARRAWRLITAPIYEGGSVYNTWQISGANTPGRGTWVTGNPEINGIDPSPQRNSSLKEGLSYTPVSNTITTLISNNTGGVADNKVFFLYVRGDRNPSNFNTSISNTTTLTGRGKIQTGTQTFNASATAGGYTMIGNPYASPVDFFKATRNNIKDRFWVWDPQLGGTKGQGAYIPFVGDGFGNYTPTISSPSGFSNLFQSSHAFIVETLNNGVASLVFEENNKSLVNNSTSFFRPAKRTSFRVVLNQRERDSAYVTDGVLIQFGENFNNEVDGDDMIKIANTNEMLGIQKANSSLAIERRSQFSVNDTIYLKLTKTKQRNYSFEFAPENLSPTLTAFVDDSYTNIQTALSVTGSCSFDFVVNADAKSAAANRFKIVFKQTGFNTLPVTFKNIKAYEQGAAINVDWTVENEINISKYEVEKSTNGVDFVKVNTTIATGTNNSSNAYNFLDINPVQGNNFYRIRSYNQSGSFDYSKIVLLKLGKTGTGISVYPNPVKDNQIGVAFSNMEKGVYQIRLINSLGQTMLARQFINSGGSSMVTFTPESNLSAGIYQLEIIAQDNHHHTIKVIVQ